MASDAATARSTTETRSAQIKRAVMAPILAMRLRYVPLLMVYFSYGALSLVAIAETFWVRKGTTLSPTDLASIAVWVTLPWTIKMVFGELVDSVRFLGSQRRGYVFLGAGLMASGLFILAGAAGTWLTFASPNSLYFIGKLLIVVGTVLQDVVADAMSTEVVSRVNADGSPRPPEDVSRELGMVQVLGRLALSLGLMMTAGLGGWLAQVYSYQTVFLLGLVIPLISASGAALVRLETSETRDTDWRVLGGGIAFGAFVVAMGLSGVPGGQEIVFVVSMVVVIAMLARVTHALEPATKQKIFFAAVIIFAFRANPTVGDGYIWFMMDVLKFDESFFGWLSQIGSIFGFVGAWLLADMITRVPITRVLLWITIAGTLMALPDIGLLLGVHHWTERVFGFGAKSIALVNTAAASPLAQISMIPLLTLTAIYAPAKSRAVWFSLMASLMNLALVAGSLQTKYLNALMPVERGQYGNLLSLYNTVVVLGFIVPIAAILIFGRRVGDKPATAAAKPAPERAGPVSAS